MKAPRLQGRTWALVGVVTPLLLLFGYVALRSGPLAPVPVTVAEVQSTAITPALSGIGTVQARYTHRIGPTFAGRVQRLDVDVGEVVKAGQVLGEMDPVDLDERIRAQQAAINSAQAALRQAEARLVFARTQAGRYQKLLAARGVSEETVSARVQERDVAEAAASAAREDAGRMRADLAGLQAQRGNARLVTPVAGLVAARNADPGSTVVAGQAVLEIIDPTTLWVDTRFDQVSAQGLKAQLPASIVLRSRGNRRVAGQVLWIEPMADAVTEEIRAKITFNQAPIPLPPIGELAEITVNLPRLPPAPTLPNAAIRTVQGQRGVWKLVDGDLHFAPVTLGRSDLDGQVQVTAGVSPGDRIVVYSSQALGARSRIKVVDRIPGVSQ